MTTFVNYVDYLDVPMADSMRLGDPGQGEIFDLLYAAYVNYIDIILVPDQSGIPRPDRRERI
jgi:hypothetical protein